MLPPQPAARTARLEPAGFAVHFVTFLTGPTMPLRTVKIGSFALGVNNRREPSELDVVLPDRSRGTYLYAADNVDIGDKGFLKRRVGTTPSIVSRTHSVWSDPPFTEAFAVVAGNLERLSDGTGSLTRTTVRTGMPQRPVSYARGADGDVYWSNGAVIRRIHAGVDRPIHAEPLSTMPAVTTVAGALPAGQYLVAFTSQTIDGESPATRVVAIDVPANGGIQYAACVPVNVYMSGPNGDVLTLQQSGGANGAVLVYAEDGPRCETLNTELMPAGSIVRFYNGRLFVVIGNTLVASNPYHYGVCAPAESYFPMPADITVLEPTDNGLYIVADKSYWVGDPFTDKLQEVLPYGAIPGTSGRSPDDEQVFWQSTQGLIVADKNMSVKNVQEDALAFTPAESGASLYREADGMTHIVTSRAGAQPTVAAVGTWMEAEIIRKGTDL